ncbi:kelch repeat-containing protein [Actinomadura sp. DC4]|uniref:kelch repeat-containing protein n=1 Tax=Actinomadura sp. DC4 TaxID=3055069 RepID=UPI0025AF64F7|nr:kelch repeat-containing protein [Actinomadura sp. DC4]MDN3358542.1 kelch repeat-containing protein [Actinomadura sp. DC4]
MPNSVDRAVAQVATILAEADRHLGAPRQLLRFLGWETPPGVSDLGLAAIDLSGLHGKIDALTKARDSGTTAEVAAAYADLAIGVADALDQLRRVAGGFSATPDYLARTHIAAEFFRRLLDFVVMQAIARFAPPIFALGQLAGIFLGEPHPADPVNFQAAHLRHVVRWDRLGTLLQDPAALFRDVYGWGTPAFEPTALIANIGGVLQHASVSTGMRRLPARAESQVTGLPVPDDAQPALQLLISLVKGLGFDELDVGVSLFGLRPTAPGAADGGIGITPYAQGTSDVRFPLADRVAFVVDSTIDIEGGVALVLRPGESPDFRTGLDTVAPSGTAPGSIVLAVRAEAAPDEFITLLDLPNAARVEAEALSIGGGVKNGHPTVRLTLEGGHIVLDASGGDGFLTSVLGSARVESSFDLEASYSPGTGLQLGGSGGLELQIPVHVELGPVEIETLYAAIGLNDGVQLELSAGFSASLGPIQAVVDRMGVRAELTFPDGGGDLGPADLSFGFKPPTGVGLTLNAGIVAGGGFLYADPDRGEYAGALELEFAGFVAVKAIGLISTRNPDFGGYSLLVVMTAEFGGTGIQLGYGFTLLAVGGLLGLNRGMNLKALVEGVRSGAVESVMFPKDVVANAPRILSDLRAFFPPEEGTFLVGPMAKIGWGTPTLISIELGVIVEIPGDLAVLGVLRALLPNPDLALLALQVDFVGAMEFDKDRVWFFARLFDSRILSVPLSGEMGLLFAWGDNPDLVITVGGFHPSYKPPPLPFPVPKRLSVDLLNRPNQLIRVSGYFAITSNTVQFGALAELRLGFSHFGVEGHLGFDALFQFSPFQFAISISAGVSLKAFGVGLFGIHLRFQLEGPAPWRAHGRGSIGFLFFEISANFDITWGEAHDTTLPPVDVLPLLAAEIAKVEGWQTRLPAGRATLVNLRTLPAGGGLVLHPLGTLFVRQRALPLDVRLDRIGGRPARDGRRFGVAPVPDSGLDTVSVTADKFAMAQYQDMDDAEKLSRPAYENQDAGLELAGAGGLLASARVVRRSARYEQVVIDSRARADAAGGLAVRAAANGTATATAPRRLTSVSPAVFGRLLAGSSTSRSVLSQKDADRRRPFTGADTVRLPGQRFVVAYVRNNVQAFPPSADLATGVAASFRSQAAAADALADWVRAVPSLAGTLHVIPAADASAPLAVPGTWTAGGAMPAATFWATPADPAVRLASGRLLVAGGTDGDGHPVASAALFDPVTNAWSAGPPLATGRQRHTTTLLADGRVLVAGGAADAALASAEIYDPLTGTWSAAAAMGTARSGHTATLLDDETVLVAGGQGTDGRALTSAERFDPGTGTWTALAPMTDARSAHQAVLLDGGRLLVVGGVLATGGGTAAMAYCELYDPATRVWAPTGELSTPRAGHQATLLPGGAVLVTGGDTAGVQDDGTYRPDSLDTAERYHPDTGVWTPAARMPGRRTRHRSVLLRTGRVLVAGGTGGPAFAAGFRNADLYDPKSDTWTTTGALALGRWAQLTAELTDGRIVAAGGIARAGAAAPGTGPALSAATEIFTP